MGSPHEVSGAAHVGDKTALRIEGVAPSVEARLKGLRELLAASGAAMDELGTLESRTFWREVRDVAPLDADADAIVWRLSCPPTEGPAIVARIHAQRPGESLLRLVRRPGLARAAAQRGCRSPLVRAALGPTGGHATLIRAPQEVRAAVPVLHPQSTALTALAARVKQSFDPKGLFNPGRMDSRSAQDRHPEPSVRPC